MNPIDVNMCHTVKTFMLLCKCVSGKLPLQDNFVSTFTVSGSFLVPRSIQMYKQKEL